MFKPHYGTGCPDCPPDTKALIVVKSGYCQKHNEERKKEKKANRIRVNEPKITEALNDLDKIKKKKFKEPTGELNLFKQIWLAREHKCEVCGKEIKDFSHNIFSHVLSKGSHGELRLDENNILIMCHEFTEENGWYGCHHRWDCEKSDEMKEDPMWIPIFKLAEALKQETNNKSI